MNYIVPITFPDRKYEEWHDLFANHRVWRDFTHGLIKYFDEPFRNPRSAITKIDQLPSAHKREYFRLNDLLGGPVYLNMYNLPKEGLIQIKSKEEEELEVAIEKATIITLQGDSRDRKETPNMDQVQENEYFKKGKKQKSKQETHKNLTPKNKNALIVQPDTMLGLVLIRHKTSSRQVASLSLMSPSLFLTDMLIPDYSPYYFDQDALNPWSPRLFEEMVKANKDGQWDKEIAYTFLSGRLEETFAPETLREKLGSDIIGEVNLLDDRTENSPRNLKEGGDFLTGEILTVPYKLVPLLKEIYKRNFGKDITVEFGNQRKATSPLPKSKIKRRHRDELDWGGIIGGPGMPFPILPMGMDPSIDKRSGKSRGGD
jgi:hypothetical protein